MTRIGVAVRLSTFGSVVVLLATGCSGGKSDASRSTANAASSPVTSASSAAVSAGSASATASRTQPTVDVAALTATELVARSKAAAKAAENLRINGAGADGAQSIGIDIAFGAQGSSGTIKVNGMPLTLLQRGGSTYFKASDAFWEAQAPTQAAQIIAVINHRWIKTTVTDSRFGDLAKLADRSALIDQFFIPSGALTKGPTVNQNGVRCVTLRSAKDGTLLVAAADARPILSKGATTADGQLSFSYDPVTVPAAPAAAEVLDAAALGSS